MVEHYDDNQPASDDEVVVERHEKDKLMVTTKNVPNIEKKPSKDGARIVSIMLPGQRRPLKFTDESLITLGRYDHTTGSLPMVDLGPYFGVSLGVSRTHAEIFLKDDRYFLRDLNSANGTWLNNQRVEQPLRIKNGDQLRLGKLLMVVFLSDEEVHDSIEQLGMVGLHSLYIQPVSSAQNISSDSIDIDFLAHPLSKYLQVLNDIQSAIFAANEQEHQPITVNALRVLNNFNIIEIQLYVHHPILIHLRDDTQKIIDKHQQKEDDPPSPTAFHSIAEDMLEKLTSVKVNDDSHTTHLNEIHKHLQKLFDFPLKIINNYE